MTVNLSSEVKRSAGYQFLLNSYESWRSGYFDSFSNYYKKKATKVSPKVLAANILNETSFKNFLDHCFTMQLPDANEIMYTISPHDYMITNKTLFINTRLNQNLIHAIPLCHIMAYKNKGVWMKSGIIKLKDDSEIEFKLNAAPDEKSLKLLQKMLGCKQLMII